MLLDFTKGHWASIYRNRFPPGAPPLEMRVMTGSGASAYSFRRRAEPSRSPRQVHAEAARCLDCDGLPQTPTSVPAVGGFTLAVPATFLGRCAIYLRPARLFGLKAAYSSTVRPLSIVISRSRSMPVFSSDR